MDTTIENLLEDSRKEVVGWRRHLHRNPEVSFKERETSQFIHETLESFGGLEISRPTETSVVARLIGHEENGRVLAIRADMDALPIQEENDFEFASQNPGVMHACGHDGHTAMLLGAAKILSQCKDQIKGEVRFLFQHAEEIPPGGAKEMVEAGVMEGVDMVIGTHLMSTLEIGKIGIGYGAVTAAPDKFEISVIGKGGHAGMPHDTIDSIAICAQVVGNLQQVVSRTTDAMQNLVLSVTQINGGSSYNVIPDRMELTGTVRSIDPELREEVPETMERVIRGVTEAHGATYEFDYETGYESVINDERITQAIEEIGRENFADDTVEILPPIMGGEDFSAYQQRAPGTFFNVGARNEKKGIVYPHHHPLFTIDEDSLHVGVRMFVASTLTLMD